jgi:hypothetical protein
MNVPKVPGRLFVLLTLLTLLFPASAQIVSGQPGTVAALDPLQGLVQYRAATAPENAWQTLTRVQLVSEGDWVRTDNLGKAELAFFEGNVTTVLPNTQIKIAKFSFVDADSPDLTIEQSVGDMRHQITRVLDANSRYEVHTPSAIIAVRGTDFWSSATWLSETTVNLLQGITEIKGVDPDGVVGPSTFIAQNQSLYVRPDGQAGMPGAFTPLPEPPLAPLAPATCGNGICDPGEEQICAVDCQSFPTCGNGICELDALEGPVTCAVDCVPEIRLPTVPGAAAQPPPALPTVQQPPPTVAPPPPPSQPCTIRTTRGNIEVRVGPGFNRGVRDYLKPNTDIPVVGKSTDPDGYLWWKIQPPGYIPAEIDRYWVLADEVDESGDCNAVPDAAASQLIVPRPTQQPTSTVGPQPTIDYHTPQPTPSEYYIMFYASDYYIDYPDCVTIYWDVEGIREVYYEGRGVVGHSSATECPYDTTTYELRVLRLDGTTTYRYVTISVSSYVY